jgi:hypothetical protein
MSIFSDASPDEVSSPFYQANKDLCEKWLAFIEKRDGKVNGLYNAWSLNFKAKVKTNKTWLISVKKATYSGGSLLFSSKYKNLQEILEFQSKFTKTDCPDFRIVKSRWKAKSANHVFYRQLVDFLSEEKRGKNEVSATFKDGLLTLRFHHRNDDFELAKRVLSLGY